MADPGPRVESVGGVPTRPRGKPLTFTWDGRSVRGFDGDTVAAALHAEGHRALMRSIKYHRPRGYFCGTGRCAGCLVRVDGVPNVRACTLPAKPGLRVESQNALPRAQFDVLSVVDRWYRTSFDYHDKFVRPAFIRPAFHAVVRRMAGFGTIPDEGPMAPRRPPVRHVDADVVVAGAGAAGLAAARAAHAEGARVLLVDEDAVLGGTLRFATGPLGKAADGETGPVFVDRVRDALAAGDAPARVLASATVAGVYRDVPRAEPHESVPDTDLTSGGIGDVVVLTPTGLVVSRPRALVVAAGANEVPPLFPSNDTPGVMGARAAQRLLLDHGVLPGKRVLLVGESAVGDEVAAQLEDAGARVTRVARDADVRRVHGNTHVTAVTLASGERVTCDAVIAATGAGPRVEILQQADARLVYDAARGGWAPEITGAAGETTMPGVFAAGSCAGVKTAEASVDEGDRAGRAAARFALKGGEVA